MKYFQYRSKTGTGFKQTNSNKNQMHKPWIQKYPTEEKQYLRINFDHKIPTWQWQIKTVVHNQNHLKFLCKIMVVLIDNGAFLIFIFD